MRFLYCFEEVQYEESIQTELRTYTYNTGALDIDASVILPKKGCSKVCNISLHEERWSFVNVIKVIAGIYTVKTVKLSFYLLQ